MKNLFNVLLVVLLINVAYTNSSSTGLDSIKSTDIGLDVIRGYKYIEKDGFTLFGASIGGGINSISLDTSVFKLSINNGFPMYFFNYLDSNFSPVEALKTLSAKVGVKLDTSFYVPTFIVEYEETNKIPGFQLNGDRIFGFVNLEKLQYSVKMSSKQLTDQNGKQYTVWQITMSSKGNLFQMIFTISDAPCLIGSSRLSASNSKIDIIINNYYDKSVNPSECTSNSLDMELLAHECRSSGPSNHPSSRLAVTSFYGVIDYDITVSESPIGGSINVVGGKFDMGIAWVPTAEVTSNGITETINSITTTLTEEFNDGFGSGSFRKAIFVLFGIEIPKEFIIVLGQKVYLPFGGFVDRATQIFANKLIGGARFQLLVHSFDKIRPQQIVWDPSIGINPVLPIIKEEEGGNLLSSCPTKIYSLLFIIVSIVVIIIL